MYGVFVIWRKGRDSNPRYVIHVYTLSRRATSTTHPPFLKQEAHYREIYCWRQYFFQTALNREYLNMKIFRPSENQLK